MTSEGSGEQSCRGWTEKGGGWWWVWNVYLVLKGYPFVSAAGRYLVESRFIYKICRYGKAYFSLYDSSDQF